MTRPTSSQATRLVFALGFLAAMAFALYTNHVWEDYYITYRSSKNLATGHGLVFNQGDRLHTFTSPLGVLLPAVSYLLTGNTSDTGALWIFRVMCGGALGGALALLFGWIRRLDYPLVAAAFLAAFVAFDAKTLDFTINGMETPFMLLFLAYALWAHWTPGPRQWLHLGAAWAGLMWTRPDSFIYIGLVAAGVWLFNDPARTGSDRRRLLLLFVRAGLVTTALYGPWLAWATWYYGTPIPNTIVAKGAQSGGFSAGLRFLENFWKMPWQIWQGKTSAEGAFLPSYYMFPAWPAWTFAVARASATVAALLWLLPRVRFEVRVASLTFFGGAAYLSFVPYFPFPWYFPSTFLFGAVALAGAAGQLWSARHLAARIASGALAGTVLLCGLELTFGAARQARAQQALIETGNRRVIGEWLKANSAPGDSVFMEPLGYIGFFSNLKTYDWPGMSSREMVDAKLIVGTNWGTLIRYLQPTWLVLRPDGEGDLPSLSRDLAASNYQFVREFSRLDDVLHTDVPGRKLLEFDARFRVYRLKSPTRHDLEGMEIASPFPSSVRQISGVTVRLVHAPGTLVLNVPADARIATGQFGFPSDAGEGDRPTDGATFRITWTDGTRRVELFSRDLQPATQPSDRGLQDFHLDLPAPRPGRVARLTFETEPGRTSTKDWTCWRLPQFTR
ncbi:MAG: hypothetical protein KF715_06915 [Candidatus Didemnitutus sp.]|nr:hypothetical protein [Candidatus Didemnitutus sp.]